MGAPGAEDSIRRLARSFPATFRGVPAAEVLKTLNHYLRELVDVPPDVLAVAVTVLIRTEREWLPSVGRVREVAAEQALALPSEPRALRQLDERIAWARLDEATRGDAPEVHPLVREALDRVGGFHELRSERGAVVRGQLARVYRDLRGEAIRDAALGDVAALPPAPARRELTA